MNNLDRLLKSWRDIREEMSKDSANPKLAPKDRKVKQLQQQVDAGTYKPDPKKIAGKMVERGVFNKSGQWSIEKSNYPGYDPVANIKRKATRTTEERESAGKNVGVRRYTTPGSQIADKRQKELESKNKQQPVTMVHPETGEKVTVSPRKAKALARKAKQMSAKKNDEIDPPFPIDRVNKKEDHLPQAAPESKNKKTHDKNVKYESKGERIDFDQNGQWKFMKNFPGHGPAMTAGGPAGTAGPAFPHSGATPAVKKPKNTQD